MYMYVERIVCFISLLVLLSNSNAAEISETMSEIKRELAKLSAENIELKSEIRDLKAINIRESESMIVETLSEIKRGLVELSVENTELKSEIRDLKAENNRVTETIIDTCSRLEEYCSKKDDNLLDRKRQLITPTMQNTSTSTPTNGDELSYLFHQMENVVIQIKDRVAVLEHNFFVNHVGTAPIKQNVAFHVRIIAPIEHMTIHQIVPFPLVELNEGTGWNAPANVFRAPVSGLYYFSSNIMPHKQEEIEVELMKDGAGVGVIYVGDANTWGVGTLSAVIHLSVGEKVWIRIYGNRGANHDNIRIHGDGFSWFSGFLI